MMYVVYDAVTGAEITSGPTLGDGVRSNPALAVFEIETLPNRALFMWSAATRMFVAKPAPTTAVISRQDFIDRLGDTCVEAIEEASVTFATDSSVVQKQKAKLRALMLRLNLVKDVNVTDTRTITGVDMLITAGYLAAVRRPIVLALAPV